MRHVNRRLIGAVTAAAACLAFAVVSPSADAAGRSAKPGPVKASCRKAPTSVDTPAAPGSVLQQGAKAPNFTATRLDCGTTTMKQLAAGKVTFINFYASWCHYCILEAPDLVKFYNTYHSKGLNGIGVDTAEGTPAGDPSFFYSKYHFPFVSVWDYPGPETGEGDVVSEDPIWHAYETQPGVACIPTTVWLHKDGTISSVVVDQMTPAVMLQNFQWAQKTQAELQTDPAYLLAQARSSKCVGA